ncbi:hypothetical protein [Paraburkholderia sp. C35]|uniref:hypothetical protein n=1 Tax=Paraburkholderia sp. C35 TaxID=2126993 RepID=UPI001EF6A481|nr:hypothetical protein [Paraburkholderia sp. C35]
MFDTDHARLYGLEEAVMIHNFTFWIARNRANGENVRDDRVWSYNSVAAFAELFPYLSKDRIRRTLDSLIKQGVLIKGNYNEQKTDRTLWYAFADETAFVPDGKHFADSPNGNGDTGNVHSAKLPNAKGDTADSLYRADGKPDGKPDRARATRLPNDWELSKEALERTVAVTVTYAEKLTEWAGGAWSIQHTLFEAEKFRDYWAAKSGKDATKHDWPATWRNWIRNAGPMRAATGKKGGGGWWLSPESRKAKAHEVGVGDPIPGESDASYQARIQAAIDNGGKPPTPRAKPVTPMDPVPAPEAAAMRKAMPEEARAALRDLAKRNSVPKHLNGDSPQ